MFKGLGQMASLLKQAQQMGGRLREMNEKMATWRVLGSAGGGMVEVEIDGLGQVLRVSIDPDLMARSDREMLESLLPAAFNQASAKLKERQLAEMESLGQDVDPGGLENLLSRFGGGGS